MSHWLRESCRPQMLRCSGVARMVTRTSEKQGAGQVEVAEM